jgi:hypothetical protein
MGTNLVNLYLRLRYKLFKKFLKKKTWTDRKLLFDEKFQSLNNFEISDNEFYNDNPVWFSKDAVSLENDGVHIKCYYDPATHTSWQGTRTSSHTSGMITTKNTFVGSNGVWVINAKDCESWCAIWLLKKDRLEPGFTKTQITPEIDILEILNNNNRVQHGIAYGYSDTKYVTDGVSSNEIGIGYIKCDNQFHEYAVEILSNGYKFYIDGILTTKLFNDDPDFVTDLGNFILLNNASCIYTVKDTDFVIKSVKFYE